MPSLSQRSLEIPAVAAPPQNRFTCAVRRGAVVWLLTWLLCALIGNASAATPAPVLILLSRNPSDAWAVAELDGLQHELKSARPAVPAVVEYMDVQGNPRPAAEAELTDYYRTKFAGRSFRLIFAADEPALDFLLRQHDTLFPAAQVVFCGITRFDPALRAAHPWLTGVIENLDPSATFRLALTLQPNLRRFVILEDSTLSGSGNQRRIEQEMPEETKRVAVELVRADTARALFTAVESLPPGTAVLLTRSQVARRMGPELLARCPVPIYGQRSPTHLGAMLGGALIDGERHGRAAAGLGLRVLAGERAADLPILPGVPPRVVVDYVQMQRFKLPFSALPPGTEILNRPLRVWEQHPLAARVVAGALGFLTLLTGWLAWALAQKRRTARALKTSLSLLNATLDASADGVLVVDSSGKVSGFNGRFAELWNIPRELIERRDDAALLAFVLDQVEDAADFLRRVQELYATPDAESDEVIAFKDGRVFERHSRPQRLEGRIIGRVWTFADITVRCRTEEANRRLEAKLSHTHRLEALGTLAGGIAHDFNNLLTAILGYTHLAHDSLEKSDPIRADLAAVLTASERARDLVQQILMFSRKSPFERRPIALESVVRDAVRLLRATTPAGVEILCEIATGEGTVLADGSQVHQAILNLGTNAAHAMRGRHGTITVRLERVEMGPQLSDASPHLGGSPCLCVLVRDTGHGMDTETLRRVFDPFFTTKAPGEGTGLGLAVVHGIMQNHEGAVTLESELGAGTTARLYFPIVDSPATVEPPPEAPAPSEHAHRVLAVDDELAVLHVAEQMLGRLGYEVVACHGPGPALELLRSGSSTFDAVITDLNMPQMSGTDLATEVRQICPEAAIVLATGYLGDGAVEQRAAQIGIEEIVTKPFTPATLGTALHRALEKAHSRRNGELAGTPP
jgi:signal transduction histidine kinase/ActR/RegA family two-component response regulator